MVSTALNEQPAHAIAVDIARLLEARHDLLVLAESCTGGLAGALVACVPGISRYFCGSSVVYREDTKIHWLGIRGELLRRQTAVSDEVTRSMALHVLERTPEATVAGAVTGHLGPDAPAGRDGQLFVAVARRIPAQGTLETVLAESRQLRASGRIARQREAAEQLLDCVRRALAEASESGPLRR